MSQPRLSLARELRELARTLYDEAGRLEEAAEALERMEGDEERKALAQQIASLKARVRDYIK